MHRVLLLALAAGVLGGCGDGAGLPPALATAVRVHERRRVPTGRWASEPTPSGFQMALTVETGVARWSDNAFCEYGTTNGPLVTDASGRFSSAGIVRFDNAVPHAVQITGTVDGHRMTIEFVYERWRQSYVLTLGREVGRSLSVC